MTISNHPNSGCASGILRLLLCKGSLQTHPSDHVPEPNSTHPSYHPADKHNTTETEFHPSAQPGVVARLMGLDSMPDSNWVPKGTSQPESIPRSRSVNFMDYLLEFDLEQPQKHRRVRTSVSFREVPTVVNQQNHDFLVLYVDNVEKGKKFESKLRKPEVENGEERDKNKEKVRDGALMEKEKKKQERKIKISELKNEPRMISNQKDSKYGSCKGGRVSSGFVSPQSKKDIPRKSGESSRKMKSPVKPTNQKEKEVMIESKFMKKVKCQQAEVKDLKSECSSQDSSPVSVLSLIEFSAGEESEIHSPGDSKPTLSSKKQHPSSTTTNFSFQLRHPTSIFNRADDLEPKSIKKRDYELHQNQDAENYHMEVVRDLRNLTEEDLRHTNWIVKSELLEFENCEEICTRFGLQILDLILLEEVEELVGFQLPSF